MIMNSECVMKDSYMFNRECILTDGPSRPRIAIDVPRHHKDVLTQHIALETKNLLSRSIEQLCDGNLPLKMLFCLAKAPYSGKSVLDKMDSIVLKVLLSSTNFSESNFRPTTDPVLLTTTVLTLVKHNTLKE